MSASALESGRRTMHHSEAAWEAFFAWPGSWPDGVHRRSDAAAYWLAGRGGASTDTEDADSGGALREHAKMALEQPASPRWHEDLALLALHSPGNIAYRALARVCDEIDEELRMVLWRAAARLANGIRTLFNRMDVMFLLDQIYGHEQPYWRSVLQYCADGNLQSVLDEYCFQLKLELAGSGLDADALAQIADRAIEALTLRTSRYNARATDEEFTKVPITVRFALRYGGAASVTPRAFGRPRSATRSTARSGRSSSRRRASGRRASTSTGGATPSCTGTCRRTPSTSSSAKAASTALAGTRFARTSRQRMAGARSRRRGRGQHPWQYAFDAAVDHARSWASSRLGGSIRATPESSGWSCTFR